MLKIKKFIFNPFEESTYVIYNEASRDAIIVDPGMGYPEEIEEIEKYIVDERLKLTGIVNTHLHLDHCFGVNYVKDQYGIPVCAHPADEFLGSDVDAQARKFGMRLKGMDVMIDAPLSDGDTIDLGDDTLKVIHTPGHSPGGICLYSAKDGFLISGDTLFNGSIGRTDLPGGNHLQLISSIKNRLFALPDETTVYPGHGPSTTIGREKRTNPYFS